jgi:hypothetical protein
MQREAAEKIVQATKKIDEILGQLDAVSATIEDQEERKKMLRAIATIALDIHEKITLQVIQQFPDLHPNGQT